MVQVLKASAALTSPIPTSAAADATLYSFEGAEPHPRTRAVPVETAINIVYAPIPFAVMMATPADLEDFAIGFSLTEGVIDSAADIRSVVVEEEERGLRLVVSLASPLMQRHLARSRNMSGRTGCGLCGIDDLASLPRPRAPQGEGPRVSLDAVRRGLAGIEQQQPLNDITRGVHAAAWCGLDGEPVAVREDVGRHNALDKLIGALARRGTDPVSGFFVITSRCSFEMVEKTAVFGARTLVAISAPTSLAIERARLHDIALLGVARRDTGLAFTGPERFTDAEAVTHPKG